MTEVKFYDAVDDKLLKFAVIIARTNGKWVFCKHRERDTFEVPGGHREKGEPITDTARRELYEETGATEYTLKPVCFGERYIEIPTVFIKRNEGESHFNIVALTKTALFFLVVAIRFSFLQKKVYFFFLLF